MVISGLLIRLTLMNSYIILVNIRDTKTDKVFLNHKDFRPIEDQEEIILGFYINCCTILVKTILYFKMLMMKIYVIVTW